MTNRLRTLTDQRSTIVQAQSDAGDIIRLLESKGIRGSRAMAAIKAADGIYTGVISSEALAVALQNAMNGKPK